MSSRYPRVGIRPKQNKNLERLQYSHGRARGQRKHNSHTANNLSKEVGEMIRKYYGELEEIQSSFNKTHNYIEKSDLLLKKHKVEEKVSVLETIGMRLNYLLSKNISLEKNNDKITLIHDPYINSISLRVMNLEREKKKEMNNAAKAANQSTIQNTQARKPRLTQEKLIAMNIKPSKIQGCCSTGTCEDPKICTISGGKKRRRTKRKNRRTKRKNRRTKRKN